MSLHGLHISPARWPGLDFGGMSRLHSFSKCFLQKRLEQIEVQLAFIEQFPGNGPQVIREITGNDRRQMHHLSLGRADGVNRRTDSLGQFD